jgi:hypothetical protein
LLILAILQRHAPWMMMGTMGLALFEFCIAGRLVADVIALTAVEK